MNMRCERGAVMVMALYFGVFLTGLLFHLHFVGQAAFEQQLVQDTADSVAYSAAGVLARGMNTLSLINLVMATAMAVLVTIKLLQVIIVVLIAVVGVLCVVSGGGACGLMQPLARIQIKLVKLENKIEPNLKNILRGLETAADGVNRAVPILAQAEAVYISRKEGAAINAVGIALPMADTLPVEKGTVEELCSQAGRQIVEVSTFFLPGNLPRKANEVLGEMLGELAGTFSQFFCGGGKKPNASRYEDVAYPVHDHAECDDPMATPDRFTGLCSSALCESCMEYGCNSCMQKIRHPWFREARWIVLEREYDPDFPDDVVESRESMWLRNDPCMRQGMRLGTCGSSQVCAFEESYYDVASKRYRIREVVFERLVSCVVHEKIALDLPEETLDADDGWPVPYVLKEDAEEREFQQKSIVLADNNGGGRVGWLKGLLGSNRHGPVTHRIGFAAAQFTSGANDLWTMDWYARLIRFRWPSDSDQPSCEGRFPQVCRRVNDALGTMADVAQEKVLH